MRPLPLSSLLLHPVGEMSLNALQSCLWPPSFQAAVLILVDRGLLDVHHVLDALAIRVELTNSELIARHEAGDFKPDIITLSSSIRWGATA